MAVITITPGVMLIRVENSKARSQHVLGEFARR
jgi:hypothetical protein